MTQARKNRAAIAALIVLLVVAVFIIILIAPRIELTGKGKYPLEYQDLIEEYSAENGLDPYFVAAVIHTESGFVPQAASSAGAMGLMQIMPETGDWIAGKFNIQDFEAEMLFDPETNIKFGCWYLNFLEERFHGDKRLVSAAYNAGHNRVAGWLEDGAVSNNGSELTNIPYKETDNYVKKVEKAYEKYKEYYEIG